jgi:hypothetical protein
MIATVLGITFGSLAIVAAIAPRRFWVWFVSHRVVCAWCGRIIRIGGPLSFSPRSEVSHGICDDCSRKVQLEFRRGPSARITQGAAVALFFASLIYSSCEVSRPANVVSVTTKHQSIPCADGWCEVQP